MSRGLGYVQASILRHLYENKPTTAWWLCVAAYEHESDDISYHLSSIRRALYRLEQLALVGVVGTTRELASGPPSHVWGLTEAGRRRIEQGLVINRPRTAYDRALES